MFVVTINDNFIVRAYLSVHSFFNGCACVYVCASSTASDVASSVWEVVHGVYANFKSCRLDIRNKV